MILYNPHLWRNRTKDSIRKSLRFQLSWPAVLMGESSLPSDWGSGGPARCSLWDLVSAQEWKTIVQNVCEESGTQKEAESVVLKSTGSSQTGLDGSLPLLLTSCNLGNYSKLTWSSAHNENKKKCLPQDDVRRPVHMFICANKQFAIASQSQ